MVTKKPKALRLQQRLLEGLEHLSTTTGLSQAVILERALEAELKVFAARDTQLQGILDKNPVDYQGTEPAKKRGRPRKAEA